MIAVANFSLLAQILCVDLQEFPIMLLVAAKQRLCQSCFHCWESGLRLQSQRYLHRCATNFFIKRLQIFYFLCSIFRMDFGFFVCCFTCSKPVNYYKLLGVKSNATSNEIKHAFFEKSKKVGSLFPSSISKKMCHQRRAA